MTLNITVVYGNRNQFTLSIGESKTILDLYKVINYIICCKGQNVLYLITRGYVLGNTKQDMELTLADSGYFVKPNCVINAVYKCNNVEYSDEDLTPSYLYRKLITKKELADEQVVELRAESGWAGLNDIINAMNGLRDVVVTIDPENYNDYISVHHYSDNNTDDTCHICHNQFTNNEEVHSLACEHSYHPQCIRNWLTTQAPTCPVCSQDVREL